jgi:ATP-dependent Lhr-like helicase
MLADVRTVIVDEIHAVAASKRGSHLALSLERLQAIVAKPLVRIGLSATQKPIDEVARFLVGAGAVVGGQADCEIVDIGYAKERDLALELPPTPLAAVMSNDQWEQVYGRVAELVHLHRTTLVFVNTRRMAERAARHLGERLGKEAVAAHHGSLAKEARLDAEQRLKRGDLKVLVATASLELGLDIGDVDLVCQLGSPRSIATFLQRAGRSGTPSAACRRRASSRSRATSWSSAPRCSTRCGAASSTRSPSCRRRSTSSPSRSSPRPRAASGTRTICSRWCAAPGRTRSCARRLRRRRRMLADGFTTRHGPARELRPPRRRPPRPARAKGRAAGGAHVGRDDPRERRLRRRPRAAERQHRHDQRGLRGREHRRRRLPARQRELPHPARRARPRPRRGRARRAAEHSVLARRGAGRSDELSLAVAGCATRSARASPATGARRRMAALRADIGLDEDAARQIVDHLARALAVLGALPTQDRIVIERFFDASGGMQLVVHSPFGSRLNRAWGLALRKRFCRRFNFEIQAAATEDAIVLSLSTSHSFPLDEVARYLHSATALDVLVQALLDAPLFAVRWRWNATTALALAALQRRQEGRAAAAANEVGGPARARLSGPGRVRREPRRRPRGARASADRADDARLPRRGDGRGRLARAAAPDRVGRGRGDRARPAGAVAARRRGAERAPVRFLDDAPIEERRTQAVQNRRYVDPESADDARPPRR